MPCFVRVSALCTWKARETWLDVDPGAPGTEQIVRELLERWSADPVLREAIEVASPSLGRTLDRIDDGAQLSNAQLRRALFSVSKYLLRMSTRPTPFGVMAGVAVAEIADRSAASATVHFTYLDDDHVRGVRPDMNWLNTLLRRYERDPAVVDHLRVVRNNLCTIRGTRLVNPYPNLGHRLAKAGANAEVQEVSIQMSPALDRIFSLADRSITVQDLGDKIAREYPTQSRSRIAEVIHQLVAEEFLVTDLRPPLTSPDPLGHVLTRLGGGHATQHEESLRDLAASIHRYAQAPAADAVRALRAAITQARVINDEDSPLQVDRRENLRLLLPPVVAEEAASAAAALRRAAPVAQEPRHLADYRTEFLERYGVNVLVPIKRVLDAEFGLGAPAGYVEPRGTREVRPARHSQLDHDEERRVTLLAAWTQEAMLSGASEVILGDARLAELQGERKDIAAPSHEICFHLLADSMASVSSGNFTLKLSRLVGSPLAGSSFGRFLYMFDDIAQDIRIMATDAVEPAEGGIAAQLDYAVTVPRLGNVGTHTDIAGHTIPVGTFYEHDEPGIVELDDLALGATEERFYVHSISRGTEVVPYSFSMLTVNAGANNIVRLLREIGLDRHRTAQSHAWQWGSLERLMYLPRVRHGRTILATARWLPTTALRNEKLSDAEWDMELNRWRQTYKVPELLQLTTSDNRIEVNLDYLLHRKIIRSELMRDAGTTFHESIENSENNNGWLARHAAEIIFPQTVSQQEVKTNHRHDANRISHRVQHVEPRHRPGGEWLFVKLYSGKERQQALLRGPIRNLIAELPVGVDRWFFMRYQDPEPHLRLRFHIPVVHHREEVQRHVLARLSSLCEAGFASRIALDEYVPECARYGSGIVLEAAERVFQADSAAVLNYLAEPLTERHDGLSAVLMWALDVVAITRSLCGDDDGLEWLVTTLPRRRETPEFREGRALLESVLNDPPAQFARHWESQGSELRRYSGLLGESPVETLPASHTTAFLSVLHMHHNRAFGINPTSEDLGYEVARSLAQSVLNRKRVRW